LGHVRDRQGLVDEAGRRVAAWPLLGHRVENFIATLLLVILREGADFHTYQMLVFEEPDAAISPRPK
jgi:hypothetical protein